MKDTLSGKPNIPQVEWCDLQDKKCLKFTFTGTLTEYGATIAIERWETLCNETPDKKFNMIWICHQMTGYEPKARIAWQNTLKRFKGKIESIWLVTSSPLIKAGAMIMSAFTSYDVKVVKTEDKIAL